MAENSRQRFERLVAEGLTLGQNFTGWDFSNLPLKWRESDPSWNYGEIVAQHLRHTKAMLDMGTGGGEFLSRLRPLPPYTAATESYPPNIPVARTCLEPLGVELFAIERDSALPFADEAFDLVINRHEAYDLTEVHRILGENGRFLTQQVGGKDNIRLNELLEDPQGFKYADHTLEQAIALFEATGFEILDQRVAFPTNRFQDIGAVVLYLTIIPWQIDDFSVEAYGDRLFALHQRFESEGELITHSHRFLIEARKK